MKPVLILSVLVVIIGLCYADSDYEKYLRQKERERYGGEYRRRRPEHLGFGGSFGEDFGSDGFRFPPPEEDPSAINTFDRNRGRKPCERTSGYCKVIPQERENEALVNDDNIGNDLTEFATRLFKAANDKPNYVISGITPQLLLSYLNWGAEGDTRKQMLAAKIPGASRDFQRLASRIQRENNEKREMKIATAFFHSKTMKMNEEFVKNSRDEVKILDVDFSNTQKAAEIVRDWAKKETNGALDLSGISFDPNTKLALTSTLYYKGKWIYEFPPAVPDFFTLENGRKVNVEMMNITKKYNYGKLGNYAEWGTIPYDSRETLVILRPNEGVSLDDMINNKLTNTEIYQVCDSARKDSTTAELTIQIPKFKIVSNTNLVEPLKKMGVTKIFSPAAELPFIAEGEDLQVSSASQQASMEVNEKGTVVVTYTQINAIALSIQRDPPKVFFRVDRPFAAMICDYERGFPLVMAKISDPTKQ